MYAQAFDRGGGGGGMNARVSLRDDTVEVRCFEIAHGEEKKSRKNKTPRAEDKKKSV